MPINDFIREYPNSIKNNGSVEYQISRLTDRIVVLTYHFKTHRRDYSSQRGLWKILGRRKRLLTYLLGTNAASYRDLTDRLRIRKLRKN